MVSNPVDNADLLISGFSDALTSNRSYRKARAMEKLIKYIKSGSEKFAELLRNPHWLLRTGLIVAAYLLAFIFLDFITKQFEELPGIVAWYPPAGLTYTLLLVCGVSFAPAVTFALFISSLFIYRMPQPPYLLFLWALIMSLIYSLAAAFLRRRIRFDWRLQKMRDVAWLVFTAVLVSALLAILSVSSSALSSNMPRDEVLRAIFHWWIGETVGVLTVTPFLLTFVIPRLKQYAAGQPVRSPANWSFPRLTLSLIGQAFSVAFTLYWVFGAPVLNEYQPMYLLALPLLWIALQRGFKGVTAAIVAVNFGVVLALWLFPFELARLDELQLLMIVNCIVGLLMGAVVTERKQTEETLQKSEKRFRALVDNSMEEISLVDSAGILTFESPTTRRPLGYSPDSFVGHNLFDLFHPDERATATRLLEQVVKHPGITEGAMFRLRHQDGSWRWMEGFLTNLLDEPAIQSVVINYRDITERKRAEAERQVLLEILQGMSASESLPDLLELIRQSLAKMIYAENFFVVFRNKSTGMFEEVFGVDKYDPAMPPSRLEKSITAYVFRTGEPLLLTQAKLDELVTRGDVELVGTKPANWLGAPLKTPKETIGVIAVQNYEDPGCYSERDKNFLASVGLQVSMAIVRKQAEQEIISLAKFPAENPNPVLRLSQDGILMYANAASSALLDMWGCIVNGAVPQLWQDLVTQVLASREIRIVDIECDGKDYSITVTPVSEMGYVDLYGRDITERKKQEEEIRSRTEELGALYQLSRALSDTNDLKSVIKIVNRHAVESVNITFACLALLDNGKLVAQAVFPIRNLGHNFIIGDGQPITALPICQRVMNKNEPVILQAGRPDIGGEERAMLLLDFAQSVCLVPLRVGDPAQNLSQPLGLLILGEAREEKREPFTPEKIRLARSIGDQAASAIRRLLLLEQAERRMQQLTSLSEIDRTIATNFDVRVNLYMILRHINEQLKVDAADVLVFNNQLRILEFAVGRGFHSPGIESTLLRLGESQAGQSALERHIHIPNVTASSAAFTQSELMKAEKVAAYFSVPLITKGQVQCVLEIYHRTPLYPSKEWFDFLNTLAGQAAIAIENSHLFEGLQRTTDELELAYDATIEGWSHALDMRDKETEGHTLRVAKMTVDLARTLGFSEKDLVQVRWGGLLHDIGKMGVPDSILLKPGPLTDEEWVIMKSHPALAFEMLSPINYLQAALDIPYCHHEKWDGSGYPRGLKGEEIPLTARIFAVVDVWDALTSNRPYRKAWSKEKARQHIQSGAGTHFDPQVVKIFISEQK